MFNLILFMLDVMLTTWRKIHNYELYEIFNESNVFRYFKIKRLSWAWRLMCKNNDRNLKIYIYLYIYLTPNRIE
jgi:hypothetical protein